MRLKEQVGIITGAASGIGRATAQLFAEEGARVVVADIDLKGGNETISLIHEKGGEAVFVPADISSDKDARRISDVAGKAYGRIDILVNNAAAFVFKGLEATVEDWQRTLSVNIIGTALCSKYAAEMMKITRRGAIVNVGSVHSFIAQPNCMTYAATKAALVQMTRNMAMDLGPFNIRVNCICPGAVLTLHTRHRLQEMGMTVEELGSQQFLGRASVPREIASAILFLASEDSSFVTGAHLMADGGYTAQ